MTKKTPIKISCVNCGKVYFILQSVINNRKGSKFCSKQCKASFQLNRPRLPETIKKMSLSRIGKPTAKKGRFYKNTYKAIHVWVIRSKGNPKYCSKCGITSKDKRIEWANVDHLYKRNLEDFIGLCCRCHFHHDIKLKKSFATLSASC